MSEQILVPGPDDRTVEVLVGGDPDGFGLLHHGGSPSAVAAWSLIDDAARAAGLRLVTYSRPGYGASTPRPEAGRYVDDVAESVAVLDHLGIGEFVTIGWSGGGPRALACAALLPDRCRAAASLAGVAPYHGEDLDWFDAMAEENHDEYHAAEQGRAVYEAYLEENFLPILQASPQELAEAMGGLVTPVDKAALDEDFSDWMSRTFTHAGAQGVTGVRDDGIAAVSPWGFDLAGIRVPVAIWQGRQDAMVPYAHGEWLAAHVPGAEAHLFDDEGHLSLVSGHIDEILADVKRLAGLS
ncbi:MULTISPECIES: alpha/beta hydrolase [unclassified Nocardioides]|uniref:alpha/beta hydrolase n=1 Tax=unclassified Nocardioides TaxID=2615069 RepID=UPI0009F09BDE|nr:MULTISPECIES: alpha/beta hydrolase [unclassified Nocardioides]GAW49048.1 alpha/beta hydrolase fold protein [Nocardioides sp. PD653-B2]GAW53204.1 alpha/beta hydrolase fold protein [Nocardioides sp. PD653]